MTIRKRTPLYSKQILDSSYPQLRTQNVFAKSIYSNLVPRTCKRRGCGYIAFNIVNANNFYDIIGFSFIIIFLYMYLMRKGY